MTRIIISICILFFTNTSYSQLNYNNFRGKWQEKSRIGKDGKLSFNDTLQLDFYKRDTVVLRNGTGVSYKGAAIFEKNTMYVSAIPFKVLQVSKNRIVIQDSVGKRLLSKVKKFHHEMLGVKPVPAEDLSDPENVSMTALNGTWDVYRTEAAPGAAKDSSILREVNFQNGGRAELTYQVNGDVKTAQAKLSKNGTLFHLKDELNEYNFHVYKAARNELVFGNHGGIVYFAKRKK